MCRCGRRRLTWLNFHSRCLHPIYEPISRLCVNIHSLQPIHFEFCALCLPTVPSSKLWQVHALCCSAKEPVCEKTSDSAKLTKATIHVSIIYSCISLCFLVTYTFPTVSRSLILQMTIYWYNAASSIMTVLLIQPILAVTIKFCISMNISAFPPLDFYLKQSN